MIEGRDDKPRMSVLIVRGAKADAERVRRVLKQAMPSRSDSVGATASSTTRTD
jgi:hypothetical protein